MRIILILRIAAFPVLWWLLDKRGTANTDERMRCMATCAQWFPTAIVNYWCADRECIGQAWGRDRRRAPSLALR